MTANRKPLTVTLDSQRGRLVRECAQAQGVTYRSLIHAILDTQLNAGRRPVILEPWGEKERLEAEIKEKEGQ